MYLKVPIRVSHGKVYLSLYGKIYVPKIGTVLGQHDEVTVDLHEGGTATVYIRHYPPETWVLLA